MNEEMPEAGGRKGGRGKHIKSKHHNQLHHFVQTNEFLN